MTSNDSEIRALLDKQTRRPTTSNSTTGDLTISTPASR